MPVSSHSAAESEGREKKNMARLILAVPEAAGVSAVFLLPGLPSPNDTRALRFLCLSEGVVLMLPPFQDSLQHEEDGGNAAGHRFKLLRIKNLTRRGFKQHAMPDL